MASRVGSWAALTTGTEPSGSMSIGSGSNRMLVCMILREHSADFTVSTFTVGGQTFDYSGSIHIEDGAADQIIKIFIWNEATIAAMSGSGISYSDDITQAKISWSYATYQDVVQVSPTITTGGGTSTQTFDLTTTSTSSDIIIAGVTDKSNNRAPLTADTLTERLAYSAADFANAIFDGVGGDNTTTLKNDEVANSTMSGMCIVLVNATGSGMMAKMMQEGHLNG